LIGDAHSTNEEPVFTTLYGDFVGVSSSIPTGPVPFLVGVSAPVGVSQLAEGFRLATRSADAARLIGRTGLVSMCDLSVAASVSTDQDTVEILTARYIEPLKAAGLAGEPILDTVAEYLRHNRSVVETSTAMFVHANTVRYRVERFESMTESSLKDLQTLAEVWWILHLYSQ
jgi:DNA-binding PucR family transcriptional regulator